VGTENTFEHDMSDVLDMEEELQEIARELGERLKRLEIKGRTITLKVRYHDFERCTRSYSIGHFIDDADLLFQISRDLLYATEVLSKPVRLLGISVSNLNVEESVLYGKQLELEMTPKAPPKNP
jgi:DNA polymerase-4